MAEQRDVMAEARELEARFGVPGVVGFGMRGELVVDAVAGEEGDGPRAGVLARAGGRRRRVLEYLDRGARRPPGCAWQHRAHSYIDISLLGSAPHSHLWSIKYLLSSLWNLCLPQHSVRPAIRL